VDVRVIAATNKDIEEQIARGNFREDFFYRLNVVPLFVPPLRDRKQDIPAMAREFLSEFGKLYGRARMEITEEALQALMQYHWPGNVRELRNLLERVVILNPTTTRVERKHLPMLVFRAPVAESGTLQQAREAYEREYILRKLDEHQGNMSRTAESLGMERSHFYRKMKALGLQTAKE
jgi:two-component system nitrogen regulation response regulator NtrX